MASKKSLIADSTDSESESEGFRVNQAYAEKYDNWRKQEEYQRLKDKYGEAVLSEASGFSESDDDSDQDSDPEEQAALLSGEVFDDEFLRVYKALKQNDPIIFDTSVKLYSDDPPPTTSSTSSSPNKRKNTETEKMNLMDYHMKLMKERNGVTEEDDSNGRKDQGYYEELSDIVSDLKAALSGDEDDEQLFKTIPKKKPEAITKSVTSVVDWGEPQNEADRFLQQFILSKPYKQDTSLSGGVKEDKATYQEVLLEPETEHSDNPPVTSGTRHRFEEPGGSEIRRYPRTLSSARDLLVREEKAVKRKEAKDRKRSEKSEDLKRFTDLRRQEMAEKLSKLQQTSGNQRFLDAATDGFAFQSLVDDEHFDPDKHDQRMSQLFGSDYYDTNDDSKKPVFEFIEGIDDDEEEDDDSANKNNHNELFEYEDEEDEADASDDHEKLSRKKKKQRKRRVKKIDMGRIPDYDDVVGGVPVRFKYCTVTPNDFGLSAEEILFSDEKELNAWASLKKAVSFRDEQEEETDVLRYNAKRGDLRHKQKILKSFFKETADEPVATKTKKRKRRGKNKAMHVSDETGDQSQNCEEQVDEGEEIVGHGEKEEEERQEIIPDELLTAKVAQKKGKRKRMRGKRYGQRGVDEERLRAYGFSKSDMKRKKLL